MFRPPSLRSALRTAGAILPRSPALRVAARTLSSSSSAAAAAGPRTLSSFSLEGKTAIVTGGARGLGYVMTQALVESGADVAIVDLNGDQAHKAAEDLLASYRQAHPDSRTPRITAHTMDVSSAFMVDEIFPDILAAHDNHIDTLVTSAGFCENFPAHEYPAERMQALWGVNVNGTYNCAATLARHLIKQKKRGSMVFIGSMSGAIVNIPQAQAPYNASKAAVKHLASSFAVEWAQYGIRVNCISPGYMLTDLTKRILEDKPDLKKQWETLTPMGKMGNPEDLKGAVVYLASDAAGYVTGTELRVDGGYTAV
ncbi:hypothetical protein BZA05DRAFT_46252 [Tricharina praecox]|uniref:uncharacterized protein n=1 Tax=Tricharina praecox TaxID=43433 RepID=UPI00221E644B|nr:uncharacterized protein BZA05DRAFT_46252 [Tricharina praecox]KAI5851878.1 hypothetical protein BZA05DRAFT_46252 [Tricharina praecox]